MELAGALPFHSVENKVWIFTGWRKVQRMQTINWNNKRRATGCPRLIGVTSVHRFWQYHHISLEIFLTSSPHTHKIQLEISSTDALVPQPWWEDVNYEFVSIVSSNIIISCLYQWVAWMMYWFVLISLISTFPCLLVTLKKLCIVLEILDLTF